jgi:hypothetical protein
MRRQLGDRCGEGLVSRLVQHLRELRIRVDDAVHPLKRFEQAALAVMHGVSRV